MSHGYVAYSRGCRCEVCREGKRAYMKARRGEARSLQSLMGHQRAHKNGQRVGIVRYVAPGVTHGTSFAYDEKCCRCWPCTDAKLGRNKRSEARRRLEDVA